MNVSLIVAMADNRVIGGDNKLLWHISEDLKYFKAMTLGKPVVMGRKTYEAIGKPLPGRPNIVITRQSSWKADGVETASSLEDALQKAEKHSVDKVMVIGGAQIYAAALPFATSVYLTHIHKVYTGDALFPDLPPTEWKETDRRKGNESPANGVDYEFVTYQRIQ
jgi:dihydrofolate reductase